MIPKDFARSNTTFVKPSGMTDEECSQLKVCNTGNELISCWQPSEDERRAIAEGGPVWLRILGRAHPPVSLSAVNPFVDGAEILV
jgi:hypothetical protein